EGALHQEPDAELDDGARHPTRSDGGHRRRQPLGGPMPTPQKEQILGDTNERIREVRGIYLADFSGMSVEKLSLLRKKCREQKVQFRVIKNTLLKRAFNERGITELDPHLEGPTGLVFSADNEMSPAKILSDFAK